MYKHKLFTIIMLLGLGVFLVSCTSGVEFTVNFDSNGGSEVTSVTSDGASVVSIPEDPTKEGYTFDGWYWDNEIFESPFTANSLLDAPLSSDMTVYAKWNEDDTASPIGSIKVTFDSTGGSLLDPVYVQKNSTVSIPVVTKDGYTLEGWYTSLNGGVTLDEKWSFTTSVVHNEITLYAKWILNTYTITYNLNGGNNALDNPLDYNFESDTFSITNPTKEGYSFLGWYNNISFAGDPISSIETGSFGNLTLYAKWVINPYTITFEANEGSLVDPITQNYDTAVTEPAAPIRAGYTFAGWFTNNQFTTQYVFDAMPADNITLYARWLINAYTITLELNGGSGIYSIIEDYGTQLTQPVVTREGYTFQGWYTEEELINTYSFTTMPDENITLYAKWVINQYTMTFEENEGSMVDSITQDYDTAVTEPAAPIRTGYIFAGWYTEVELTNVYTFTTMPSADLTLYAKWNIITYEITYELDGGINNIDNPNTYTIETSTIILEEATKEGYTFLGWYDNAEYSGESMAEITLGTTEDMTLYAKWSINSYEINYYIYNNYDPLTAIPLYPGESIISIELGKDHSSALSSSGRVFIWGSNDRGQLGDGTTIDKTTPTEITSSFNLGAGETIISINLGYAHSSALSSTGRVFTWGLNSNGQLGDGTTIIRTAPTEITSQFNLGVGETIIKLTLGGLHSSSLSSTGRVFTWGSNFYGQLGNGTTTGVQDPNPLPIDITNRFSLRAGETISSINLGRFHSSALSSTGRVFTWGWNIIGQLGDGTTTQRTTPTNITSRFNLGTGETIISMSLGNMHSSTLTSTGRIFTWGENTYGQLGDGTTIRKYTPTEITSGFNLGVGETIISINLGFYHSSALSSTGRVFTWGYNGAGQLGDGTTIDKTTPTEITSRFNLGVGESIISINLGYAHSSALTSTCRVFTWGSNFDGQLGDNMIANKSTPTEIATVTSELIESYTYDFGANITVVPTLEGYTFSGWYSDIYLSEPYTSTTMSAHDTSLFGRWIPATR